jgi:ubiquitin C-terminal hydrolase
MPKFVLDRKGRDFLQKLTTENLRGHEIELRFGHIINNRYQPSVSQKKYLQLIEWLSTNLKCTTEFEESKVSIYENNIRHIIRVKTGGPSQPIGDNEMTELYEHKHSVGQCDIAYRNFVLRISDSIEEEIFSEDSDIRSQLGEVKYTRYRTRYQFRPENARYIYVLSEIRENHSTATSRYEFEIEFDLNVFENVHFMRTIEHAIQTILPICLDNVEYIRTYLPINLQTPVLSQYRELPFNETKPVNLKRHNISEIRTNHYTVTNKLDGERFIILINDFGVYSIKYQFVDRLVDKKNTQQQLIILDTEWFQGDNKFHVFDCMYMNGSQIVNQKHSERLQYAATVAAKYSDFLVMKKFFPVEQTAHLLSMISKEDNDGLIYTHDSVYNSNIYKWKFPTKMSIDFRVTTTDSTDMSLNVQDHRYQLNVYATSANTRDTKDQPFSGSEQFPLSSHAMFTSSMLLENKSIHEFTYDIETQLFSYLRARSDKSKPNYYKVAMDVWDDINNPFTEHELITMLKLSLETIDAMKVPICDDNDAIPTEKQKQSSSDNSLSKKYRYNHNLIKRNLIYKYCKKCDFIEDNLNILDLGFGRGGDLPKYRDCRVKELWGVDPDLSNLKDCQTRLTTTYTDMADRTYLIEGQAQNTELIRNKIGNKKMDIVASFFSLSFFFGNDNDLNGLADTIAYALKDDGIFIGTTIDGVNTRNLLSRYNNLFTFKAGHIKKLSDNQIEFYLPSTIVKTQVESFVDFSLLVEKLASRGISLLERSDFKFEKFLSNEENELNSLYMSFAFVKDNFHALPQNTAAAINEKVLSTDTYLLEKILLKLSTPEYQDDTKTFEKVCTFPIEIDREIDNPQQTNVIVNFPYREHDRTKFLVEGITRTVDRGLTNEYLVMKQFVMNYFQVNTLTPSIHFTKTYGCLQQFGKIPYDYSIITKPNYPSNIISFPIAKWMKHNIVNKTLEKMETFTKVQLFVSIVSQIGKIIEILLRRTRGYPSLDFMIAKDESVEKIQYDDGRTVPVVGGWFIWLPQAHVVPLDVSSVSSVVPENIPFVKYVLFGGDQEIEDTDLQWIDDVVNLSTLWEKVDALQIQSEPMEEEIKENLSSVVAEKGTIVIDSDDSDDSRSDDSNVLQKQTKHRMPKYLVDDNSVFTVMCSPDDHRRISLRGIYNMGNTCYMNSALQCLSTSSEMIGHYCDYNDKGDDDNKIEYELSNIIKKIARAETASDKLIVPALILRTGSQKPVYDPFIEVVRERLPDYFDIMEQQDPNEFINLLFGEIVPFEIGKGPDMSHFIYKTFGVTSREHIMCTGCTHERDRVSPQFLTLDLNLDTDNKLDISVLLEQYSKPTDSEPEMCSNCTLDKPQNKSYHIEHTSQNLIINIKRIQPIKRETTKNGKKIVEFSQRKYNGEVNMSKTLTIGGKVYEVFGIIKHIGENPQSGHYISYIKFNKSTDSKWYEFNDDNITSISFNKIYKSRGTISMIFLRLME